MSKLELSAHSVSPKEALLFRYTMKSHITVETNPLYPLCNWNLVADKFIKCGGGQRIVTADGYIFPLSICQGLPYMKMRPFTTTEYAELPHVTMSSDKVWDPSIFDNEPPSFPRTPNISFPLLIPILMANLFGPITRTPLLPQSKLLLLMPFFLF